MINFANCNQYYCLLHIIYLHCFLFPCQWTNRGLYWEHRTCRKINLSLIKHINECNLLRFAPCKLHLPKELVFAPYEALASDFLKYMFQLIEQKMGILTLPMRRRHIIRPCLIQSRLDRHLQVDDLRWWPITMRVMSIIEKGWNHSFHDFIEIISEVGDHLDFAATLFMSVSE